VPELTVASFNVHWGLGARRDGYPRFDVVAACRAIDADVLALQECWAPDDGTALQDEVAAQLGYAVVSVANARSVLQPKPKVVSRAPSDNAKGIGEVRLALLARMPVRDHAAVALPQLPVDPSSRHLLWAELDLGASRLPVVATHFSHLEFGSPLQGKALRRALPPASEPAVFLGDMNMWGWTISAMVGRGWRRVVQGKTWPAHRPSHQIDHVLVTHRVEVLHGEVLADLGSDHRAIRSRLRVP
jgi:endonuclease/exonuclease/phosphatase family metal-dependent hydrolase